MHFNHLPLLHVFRLVAERGSFQGAATALELPRSSVSKKVRQLEEAVGQPLLRRSTRSVQVTEVGQQLLDGSGALAGVLEQLAGVMERMQATVSGKVKLSTSVLLGQAYILPLLQELRRLYPDVELDIGFEDRTVDLLAEQVDIALRIGALPDSNLIARRVGSKHWGWFASPAYLASRGRPQSPQQLADHDCLVFKAAGSGLCHWPFQGADGTTFTLDVKPVITTDNSRALVDMACAGLGVIMADPLLLRNQLASGELVAILGDWRHPEVSPISLVCLGRRSRAAQAVWAFLVEALPPALEPAQGRAGSS
ncbi:LysR family transcriptional regulator [Gallaecimonas sp. GXIMD4217]|uniref:LysR family transcriptional regulator n=1 Tax=Gallaecimonas sp. GXIMD4217 TaxID=3131927 RepID=UPI00311B1DF9